MSCKKKANIAPRPETNTEYHHYFSLAEKNFENQIYDSAYYYYNKSKLACDATTDNEKIIYSLLKMAIIQQMQGDYSSSETSATEAIPFFQKATNFYYKCAVYNILGINYENLLDYDNAIYYYNQAFVQAKDELQKAVLKNNIAVVYMDKKEYRHAIQILLPLTLKKEVLNNSENYARVLDNLGFSYFKVGNLKSLDHLNQSLTIRKKIKDDFGMTTSYLNLSEFYQTNNSNLSYNYAQLAYGKATEINNVDDRLKSISLLIQSSIGNQSKKHSEDYLRINDSINKERQKAKNQFAKIKYDSKKEKEENLKLKAQKAENALQLEQQKNRNQLLYFAVGIIILISIFISNFLVAKNKREKIKTSYNTEIRIAKKLHDELANDVYHTMAFAETQDLSKNDNKEKLLTNLDTIYSRTRNISKENSTIETGPLFISNLKDMISGFINSEINILTNGIDSIHWAALENNKKITVYRVLQELLVNMKKHSQCSLVILTFKKNKNKLQIDYSDNGTGAAFDKLNSKNGLQNVENRILALNGTITFDTESNKGFKVSFMFPL
ncbi:ATP-binding protein [Flavobacterium sp.]|uniref:tetratricopeptide repeat-containing sensor histidine kinase n=1 Tax=Flavobacterium sp. TaxID=239 RepID=UPI001B656236|nr:ATP-binding protein [Flavobacterium sp.]MBP6182939.1 ATP-binding protein [Flavobacterium sp.]